MSEMWNFVMPMCALRNTDPALLLVGVDTG